MGYCTGIKVTKYAVDFSSGNFQDGMRVWQVIIITIGVFEGGAKRGFAPPKSFRAPPKIFIDAVTRKKLASRSRDCIYSIVPCPPLPLQTLPPRYAYDHYPLCALALEIAHLYTLLALELRQNLDVKNVGSKSKCGR